MNKIKRINNLDNVKWILTLLMVLYHISYRGGGGKEEFIFTFIKNFGDCVVPAFAIISGFLFWVNVDCFLDVKLKMKKRVYTLLVPYVLWNLLNTLGLNLLSVRGLKREIFDINIWNHIIKWDSSPHFWYIFMLIFWTVFAPVLYAAYKDKRILVLLLLSQIVYLVYKGDGIYHSRFIFIIYTWGGYLGYCRPNIWDRIILLKEKQKNLTGLGALVLYFVLCFFIAVTDVGMHIKVWIYALKAISIILFTINLPFERVGKVTGFRYSFWIYAVHYWLDCFVADYVGKYITGLFYQFITWLLVFVIALTSAILFDKISPSIFNILNGSRSSIQGGNKK